MGPLNRKTPVAFIAPTEICTTYYTYRISQSNPLKKEKTPQITHHHVHHISKRLQHYNTTIQQLDYNSNLNSQSHTIYQFKEAFF